MSECKELDDGTVDNDGDDMPTTPENTREWFQLNEASPPKIRATLSHGYRSGNLSNVRLAIADDVDHSIPEISLQAFIDYLLPPLRDELNIDSIVRSVVKRDRTLFLRGGRVFKDFQKHPADRLEGENEVFAPLVTICEKICCRASAILREEQTCHLDLRPDYTPWSERNSTTRPDAYLVLNVLEWYGTAVAASENARDQGQVGSSKKPTNSKPPALSWYDLTFPGEVKKGNTIEDIVDVRFFNLLSRTCL